LITVVIPWTLACFNPCSVGAELMYMVPSCQTVVMPGQFTWTSGWAIISALAAVAMASAMNAMKPLGVFFIAVLLWLVISHPALQRL